MKNLGTNFIVRLSYIDAVDPEKPLSQVKEVVIEAVNYMEAETIANRIIEEESLENGRVDSIRKSNLIGLLEDEDATEDIYYKCRVVFFEERENGKPKRIIYHYLVSAENIRDCFKSIVESLDIREGELHHIERVEKTNIESIY